MATLTEIGAYLAANGEGVLDQTIWLSYMPDDPVVNPLTTVTSILTSPGAPSEEVFNADAVLVLRFQVLVRAVDYPTALTKSTSIRTKLHAISNQSLSGANYLRVRALQSEPFPLGPPDGTVQGGRWRLACNYEAWRSP
jgi:hypothetical protein